MTNPPQSFEPRLDVLSAAGMSAVRVLLLDDDPANLHLRCAILRENGYECFPSGTIEEATELLDRIDIAVLDYHLGGGQFGTEIATLLRRRRPHIPIIILSATLDRCFAGAEDMHLLKGHSSVQDLLGALNSFATERRGAPVVVDARDFFYSRIARAIGDDALVQIFDGRGVWIYCNEAAAEYLGRPRDWFAGRCVFEETPEGMRDWRDVLLSVPRSRETYIDRTRLGLMRERRSGEATWSVLWGGGGGGAGRGGGLAFPLTLHDGRGGVVLTARVLENEPSGPVQTH